MLNWSATNPDNFLDFLDTEAEATSDHIFSQYTHGELEGSAQPGYSFIKHSVACQISVTNTSL